MEHEGVLAVNLAVVWHLSLLLKVIGNGKLRKDSLLPTCVIVDASTEERVMRGIHVATRQLGICHLLVVRVVDGAALLVLHAVAHRDLSYRA